MTCTECGRCQSQCPAWNTGKDLSPKLLIMDLRDELFRGGKQALVPDVITDDVLWACTTCGACVEQCPVDIEHIDAIIDMRRYEVLIESRFPTEAGAMLRNVENRGDPWGLGAAKRLEWTESLDFDIPVVDGTIPDDVEYLFWVGCAGALDERARKTTQSLARLLRQAGVTFAVLGPAESCTGDPVAPARQRVPVPDAGAAEHRDLDRRRGEEGHRLVPALLQLALEGVPVTRRQLRGHPPLAAAGRSSWPTAGYARTASTPRSPTTTRAISAGTARSTTRPARSSTRCRAWSRWRWAAARSAAFAVAPAVPACGSRSDQGKRINLERTDEALATGADVVSTACPYCLIMLDDAVKERARDDVRVLDVALLLERSMEVAAGAPGASPETASPETAGP